MSRTNDLHVRAAEAARNHLPTYLGAFLAGVLAENHAIPALVEHQDKLATDLLALQDQHGEDAVAQVSIDHAGTEDISTTAGNMATEPIPPDGWRSMNLPVGLPNGARLLAYVESEWREVGIIRNDPPSVTVFVDLGEGVDVPSHVPYTHLAVRADTSHDGHRKGAGLAAAE